MIVQVSITLDTDTKQLSVNSSLDDLATLMGILLDARDAIRDEGKKRQQLVVPGTPENTRALGLFT